MKKYKIVLLAVLILAAGSMFQQVSAQQKSKAELEKEAQLQQAIDEQKKAMADQKAARAEAEISLQEQEMAAEDMLNELEITVGTGGRPGTTVRSTGQRNPRTFTIDAQGPFDWAQQGGASFFGHAGGDSERTTWDFSKSVKENTYSKTYAFDVEKTIKNVVMSVMGDCKAGEIRIKIIMPNGKNYSEIVIDEFGNLNWRKSFAITETENQDKTGEWKFQISSSKATGFFKISLQTY
jgi:type II secretory pathway pseudopilin PulG